LRWQHLPYRIKATASISLEKLGSRLDGFDDFEIERDDVPVVWV